MAAVLDWHVRLTSAANSLASLEGSFGSRGLPVGRVQLKCFEKCSGVGAGFGVGGRPLLTAVQAGKRQVWTAEPLVRGKVTKRAMHVIRDLRIWMSNAGDEESLFRILDQWVSKMSPERRDWLDVLKDFDNKRDRGILFKVHGRNFAHFSMVA